MSSKEIRANSIVTDIEGTTTAISFVKDTLFKYAYENCESFLRDNFESQEIQNIIENLCSEAERENFQIKKSKERSQFISKVTSYVQKLINEDRKVGALKLLQGKIWKFAFENGLIKGHVFDDIPRNFKKWTDMGIKLYIYSSGSVEAQRLLFKYSAHGDLTAYISGYFDTNVGHKQEAISYENILKHIKVSGQNVLFLSDIPNELYAAEKASITTLLLNRPFNYPVSDKDKCYFQIVNNFDEINVKSI